MKRVLYACLPVITFALTATSATGQLATSCWPKFHRDYAATGRGLYGGTGSELTWIYTAGGTLRGGPVIGIDGAIYFTCDDGRLYALNGDGTTRWTYACNSDGNLTPAIAADGTVYVASTDNYVYAIKSDGAQKWRRLLSSRPTSSIAVGADGTAYVGCNNGQLVAIKPDGGVKWTYTAGGVISSAPAIGSDGTIYFGCQDSKVYALYTTGTLKWKFAPYGSGTFVASPAVGSDGTIYIGSSGGFFYAINSNGTQKWRVNAGGVVRSSAAISSNGTIYYGCRDNKVHALSSGGTTLWTYTTGHYVDSSPAIGSDGGIYVGSLDGNLYAINPDGTLRWRYYAGAAIYSSPAIGPAGALFAGCDNGNLYCFAADRTPPSAPNVTDDGDFTSATDYIRGAWSASDAESGVFAYEYCVNTSPGASDVAAWLNVGGATQHTRTGLTLNDKQTYYITVRAINGAGLTGPAASSDGITVDATPPNVPIVTDDGRFSADPTSLHATWGSFDPESGIGCYSYAIGTSLGASDVVGWTDVGLATSVTRTGLALQSGVTYYISVRARNAGGLNSPAGSSDGITVDTTAPTVPVVIDSGEFVGDPTSILASWTSSDPESGITRYEYSVGTTKGGTQTRSWTDVGSSSQLNIAGLNLVEGLTYYVNVRATNGVGLVSTVGSSDGIRLDFSPPDRPIVTDEGAYSSSNSELRATWSSSDPQSGIASYKYAIGTSAGAANVVGWTDAGLQTSITRTGLNLFDGTTYYISVIARNGVGLDSPVGSSDGVIVDSSPPSRPVVTDDGNFTIDSARLHATWSASDPHSGIARYEYSVGTEPGLDNVVAWKSAGSATDYVITGLALNSGIRYYINVRAVNLAGVTGPVGTSDGIFVESTPPTRPIVVDSGVYTSDTTSISASWTADDPETRVIGYQVSIGTSPGAANVVPWTAVGTSTSMSRTNLSLVHGLTYYVNVKAVNGIGLWSDVGSSDGLTVDTTAPSAPSVTDDGSFTANNAQLHAVVAAEDPESGISNYDYCVGTTPAASDVFIWTSGGVGPDIVAAGLSLENGKTYYITVRATNGAGIVGPPATSDGITVDTTPPIRVSVKDDGDFSSSPDSLHGRWTAEDPESGIAYYKMCIGTMPGLDDVAGWMNVGPVTENTREGLHLVSGQTYFITVIAVNRAGGESAPVSSDGLVVDLTPPAVPTVLDSGLYWGSRTSMYGSWNSSDAESGIVEYQMAVGSAPGQADVAPWQSVGLATSFTRTGLSLRNGDTYYVSIRARNGAGQWSEIGSSDGILLDATPPTTPVVIDDGDTTSVLDSLHATWRSEDAESGMAEYYYCVGTSPGATDVRGWTSSGFSESVTITGITLDPVLRYYFSVKARNRAGLWSAVSASDGIGYSSGSAIWGKFRSDQANRGVGLFNATRVNELAWVVPTSGYVESSPAIAVDGTTYIGSGDGNVYAVTQNGTLRWTYNIGSPIDSSPAIAPDGRILIGANDGAVSCLNPGGQLIWRYQAGDAVRSSPLIKDGTVYFGSMDGYLYALRLDDGVLLWRFYAGGGVWSSPSADAEGVIYCGSGNGYLYAINPDGSRKWRFRTGSSLDSSPASAPTA